MKDSQSGRFSGIFIPVEILEMDELSPIEQILLSWIDALYHDDDGGCFASNTYLAQKLKVKENTISKSLTKFRLLGLIEDVSFNGRRRVIRALVAKKVDEVQSKRSRKTMFTDDLEPGLDLNPMQTGIKIQPCIGEKSNALIYREKSLEKRGYIHPASGGPSSPAELASDCVSLVSKSAEKKKQQQPTAQKPSLIQHRESVYTTQEQHDELLAKFGNELMQLSYDRLQEWKETQPTKEKVRYNDYGRLKRWVIGAVRDQIASEKLLAQKEQRAANQPLGNGQASKDVARKFLDEWVIPPTCSAEAYGDCVQFSYKGHAASHTFSYNDKEFFKSLQHQLLKVQAYRKDGTK